MAVQAKIAEDKRVNQKKPSPSFDKCRSVPLFCSNIHVQRDRFAFTVTTGGSVYRVALASGACYAFYDIPVGTMFRVTEDNYAGDGYATASSGSAGAITAGTAYSVAEESYASPDRRSCTASTRRRSRATTL